MRRTLGLCYTADRFDIQASVWHLDGVHRGGKLITDMLNILLKFCYNKEQTEKTYKEIS